MLVPPDSRLGFLCLQGSSAHQFCFLLLGFLHTIQFRCLLTHCGTPQPTASTRPHPSLIWFGFSHISCKGLPPSAFPPHHPPAQCSLLQRQEKVPTIASLPAHKGPIVWLKARSCEPGGGSLEAGQLSAAAPLRRRAPTGSGGVAERQGQAEKRPSSFSEVPPNPHALA